MFKQLVQIYKKRKIKRLDPEQSAQRFENPYFPSKKTKTQHTKWKAWLKRDGWALGGIIVLISAAVWYIVFYQQSFALNNIQIAPTQFISQDQINQTVTDVLNERYVGIVPKNTTVTVRTTEIEEAIQDAFTSTFALSAVQVEKVYPHTLNITVTERVPSMTWVTTQDGEKYYSVDREGIVTQIVASADQANHSFPTVRDPNRSTLALNDHVVSPAYVEFLLAAHERVQANTDLQIDSFLFPPLTCYKREYVAEKIFQEEILKSTSEEYKEKKRTIQQQLQEGTISIDESLQQLEEVKTEELEKVGEHVDAATDFQWRTVYDSTQCNFVKAATDIALLTTEESGSFRISMDTTIDLQIQVHNLQTLLNQYIIDNTAIEYIDLRIPDRAYYK